MSAPGTGNEPNAERVNAATEHDAPHGRCLACLAPLPPPSTRTKVKRKFCRGQVCRSRWHNERKRQLVAAAVETAARFIAIVKELAE